MISLVKSIWGYFGQSEDRRRKLQELYEEERKYLDGLIAEEEQNDVITENTNDIIKQIEDKKQIEATECSKREGTVTHLDSNHGFIDETIFFDLKVLNHLTSDVKVGSRINYLLYQNPRTDHLTVVKIISVIDHCWDDEDNIAYEEEKAYESAPEPEYFSTCQRNIIGTVIALKPNGFTVETEYKTIDVDLKSIKCEFIPKEGDRIYCCCEVQNDEGYVDRHGEILDVLGIYPTRLITNEKCVVTAVNNNWAVLNENCYITFDLLPMDCQLNVGDTITADIIECERGKYSWRCVRFRSHKMNKNTDDPNQKDLSNRNENQREHLVTVTEDQVCVFGGLDQKQTIDFKLVNNSNRTMIANGIYFVNQRRSSALINLTDSKNANGFEVLSKSTYILQFQVQSKFFGETREKFTIDFGNFKINRSININVCEDEETAENLRSNNVKNVRLNSTNFSHAARYSRSRQDANKVWAKSNNQIIPGVSILNKRRFVAKHIHSYDIPTRLRDAYLSNEPQAKVIEQIEGMYSSLKQDLSYQNYVQRFQILLFLEEIECFINFRLYDRDRAHFRHEGEYLALDIENLAEKRPSLVIGDVVRAINPFVENSVVYEGIIHKVFGDRILLKFNKSFHSIYANEDYRLQFFFSRFTYRKSHFAIERVYKNFGESFLFPSKVIERTTGQLNIQLDEDLNMLFNNQRLAWFNRKLNEFQKRAVCNILRGEAYNMPYVIFGPPGTGKTVTIIETILQLLKNVHSSRIIVATPSNSSANLIATRLIESGQVRPGDFVRIVSMNLVGQDLVPEHLMPYCATVDIGLDGTCKSEMTTTESGLKLRCQMKYLGRHRITIATCSTIGNYFMLNFPPDHFSHVLVDEAGQCVEPEIMIAIAQLSRHRGQVVLAGDPQQLQPIVINRYADERGYALSFLERILKCGPYRKTNGRFASTCGFDPRLVTKLLYNYRALPSILKIYNNYFYDSELLSTLDENDSKEAKTLKKLTSHLFDESEKRPNAHGVFFYGVRSENMQDNDSPSWYNKLEARNVFQWTVKLYRQNISSENIGIITPYARQVKFLRNMFVTASIEVPKIGTVEEFQGQERDVILISTVRSSTSQIANDLKYSLGFVGCGKRMNVSISRARCLMIVFGNPHLLCQDPQWRGFIKHCIAKDAYEGCDPPESFNTMNDIR